jgi:hypothetical protein
MTCGCIDSLTERRGMAYPLVSVKLLAVMSEYLNSTRSKDDYYTVPEAKEQN